jgi:hypothetical protein
MFFGHFGGRNSRSRYLLLFGAPLCFLLQARPVKLLSKQLFFMCSFPPGIVLSLMPAPQQALLSMDVTKAYAALYAPEEQVATKKRAAAPEAEKEEVQVVEEDEADTDVEDQADEDVEDEAESEQEESDEEDEDDLED